MNVQSPTNQSIRNSFLGFYESNRQMFRILYHVLMWVVVHFVLIRSTASRIFEDNIQVINTATFIDLLQTIALYYFIGYYVFPKLFYQRHYTKLLLVLVIIFFGVYQLNFHLFYHLASISNHIQQNGKITYAIKISNMVQESGWLGCFTNLRISLWNLSYGFFFANFTISV